MSRMAGLVTAWIIAAVLAALCVVAIMVAALNPDSTGYQLGCALGGSQSCSVLQTHQVAVLLAGVSGVATVIALVVAILLTVLRSAATPPGRPTDPEQLVETARAFVRRFPDLHIADDFALEDVIVIERELVASQITLTSSASGQTSPAPRKWRETGWRVEVPGGWMVELDATGAPIRAPWQRQP